MYMYSLTVTSGNESLLHIHILERVMQVRYGIKTYTHAYILYTYMDLHYTYLGKPDEAL